MDLSSRLRLYVISPPKVKELWRVKDALNGGATAVQLRLKNAPKTEILESAKRLKKMCEDYGALFIVNDYVDVAIEANADGVHLGADDMALAVAREMVGDLIIGRTVRSVADAVNAVKDGADYLGAGSVFKSSSKNSKVIGLETLKAIVSAANVPVVAIGGITSINVIDVLSTGVAGVAVLSAIMYHPNIFEETKKFRKIIDSHFLPHGIGT